MGSFFNQMDRKYKAEWLKALRSGEYQQARGKLYDGTGYCCLGVLCKVAGSKFVITNPDDVRHESDYPVYEPTKLGNDQPGDAESLNDHGLQMFGFDTEVQDMLAAKNDGNPAATPPKPMQSFAEIADWIEENL
jgi:hypothetical protein